MSAAVKRSLVGTGSLGEADHILELRDLVVQASMDCTLAERALITARVLFQAAERADPPTDPVRLGRIAGTYTDASKRDYVARRRWQEASRQLVEALEGRRL